MEKRAAQEVNPYLKNILAAAIIGALVGTGGLSASHLISGKEHSEKEALIQNLKAAAKGALVGGGIMSLISQAQLLDAISKTAPMQEGGIIPDFSIPDDAIIQV